MTPGTEDPLVRSSRREAALVLLVWLGSLVYTVGYCGLYAYDAERPLRFVWGLPDWVLFGVVAPWAASIVISAGFAWFVMRDEPLGAEEDRRGEEEML
jgi:hypothetical protein